MRGWEILSKGNRLIYLLKTAMSFMWLSINDVGKFEWEKMMKEKRGKMDTKWKM